ncbi:trypsin-like serine peptidase [Actomonas aquatica]|uniref:Serine protease n=1 Tax=Actomonas aquatica TaxID=2866162 RepID=A0ABZ1C5Y2_9BACT|nr:serine protease [Opitutus sp. WL0086]WRQ86663.1 serine protease [Opitutus sp. WL0086]
MLRSRRFPRLSLLTTLLCLFYLPPLLAIDIQGVRGRGETETAAMRDAADRALRQALSRLDLNGSDADRDDVLSDYDTYFRNRRLISTSREGDDIVLTVNFTLDEVALRDHFVGTLAVRASRQLDEPQIAFALVPRAPQGTTLNASDEQALADALTSALGQLFSEYRFRIVSPQWLREQHEELTGQPENIEKFKLNARNLSKMDPDVHYLVVGTAIVDLQQRNGEYDVSVSFEGEILDTHTETNLALPLNYQTSLSNPQERVAMITACSEVARRIGQSKAIPQIVADWNDRADRGAIQIIHLFYDSDEFREFIEVALEDKGRLLSGSVTLADNLVRLRYQSPTIVKDDFNRAYRLRRLFGEWENTPERYRPAEQAFHSVVSASDIVIAPDTPEYRELATAIIENRKYEVIDLPEPPPALVQNKPAERPVDPDPDTALAMVAKAYSTAVGLAAWKSEKGMGRGTAWAIAPNVYATNAHVAKPISEALAAGRGAVILPNRTKGVSLKIVSAVYHSEYERDGNMDVGLLLVETEAPKFFPLADDTTLRQLDSGEKLAYLGFPAAGKGGNVNYDSPIASMQSGIVVAVSDGDYSDAGPSGNTLIRHNIPSFGGASGSPLFNTKGEVVGIHFAGLAGEEYVKAMINFGCRIDVLKELMAAKMSELSER